MGQMGQLAKSPMAEEMTKQMIPQDDGTDQEAQPAAGPASLTVSFKGDDPDYHSERSLGIP